MTYVGGRQQVFDGEPFKIKALEFATYSFHWEDSVLETANRSWESVRNIVLLKSSHFFTIDEW